jgi:hypothetical protein
MKLLKIDFGKSSQPDRGEDHLHKIFETIFYAAGLALMLVTIVIVAIIVCGIIYCLFDALILHRVPYVHLPANR